MSLRIAVTIPRNYLLDQLNVGTPHDVELYQECIAFAFTDRWDVSDLQFQISDIATAHFFDCAPTDPSEAVPTDNDFSVALQAAVERYKFTKTGDPNTFMRGGSRALDYLFTPLMTVEMSADQTAPEEPIEEPPID